MSSPQSDGANAPVTLRDLLGALARDVTAARAHADAEAMRYAQLYRADPLLRTLPVPLFRLADLTISLPVAITSVPVADDAPGVSLTLATSTVLALILEALARHGGASDGAPAADVARAIDAARARLEREPVRAREPGAVADALLEAGLAALSSVQHALLEADGDDSKLERQLRREARARILALAPPAGMQIEATTAAIDAVSSRDSLMQLRVDLREQGVAWAIGEQGDRLVPE